ncbi:MAG: DUF4105 domain-containing protein [Bacteroidota bacterium]|nr:DUF4105 domain-containing protein [Bacteroidota bacterium]
MIKKILFLLFVLVSLKGQTQPLPLSPSSEVSLITCSPGDEIYAIYGHSAIRVKDDVQRMDVVFNYGVFDFNAPHFIYRFCKGQTDYMLSVCDFPSFAEYYKEEGRSVYEQVLNLTPEERQRLFAALLENYKIENRIYRYNFFFNNCSTKVRDMVVNNVSGKVSFLPESLAPRSFRQLLKLYMGGCRWVELGINMIVGSPADEVASANEEMFLPEFMMSHFSFASINVAGISKPLVSQTNVIYQAPARPPYYLSILNPFLVFLLVFISVLTLTIIELRGKKNFAWLDPTVYGLVGLAGLIILWITCCSEHPAVRPNLNLIWALPLHFFFAIAWFFKKIRGVLNWYHLFTSILLILFILSSYFLPQSFDCVVYLFVLILLSRSLRHVFQFIKERRIASVGNI